MTGLKLRLIFVIACAGVIAGCSQPMSPSPFQVTPSQARDTLRPASVHYKELYDFQYNDDPAGNLVYLNGKLYGTTDGGNGNCFGSGKGCGTIFSVNLDGTNYATLYTFTGTQDGGSPVSLVAANGKLYGSTSMGGGAHGYGGLVFEVSLAGKFRVLHKFGATNDGSYPGNLVFLDSALYGITASGGRGCKTCGTVFRLTLAGQESWVHTFGNGFDGLKPTGSLIAVGSTLYGATSQGGPYLSGAIFKISETGKERMLHGFGLYNDRLTPSSPLAVVNGTLYGAATDDTTGLGAIFSMATDGTNERVNSKFQSNNGSNPVFGLVAVNATLYGVTTIGGVYGNPSHGGTVFNLRVNASKVRVLHSFGNWPDGYDPQGSLVYANGSFYGMTIHGGKNGGGMVFSMSGAQ